MLEWIFLAVHNNTRFGPDSSIPSMTSLFNGVRWHLIKYICPNFEFRYRTIMLLLNVIW